MVNADMPTTIAPAEDASDQRIRERILHILGIYPRLSPSMLHVGLGTSLPIDIWKPIMQRLQEEGVIEVISVPSTTPAGRSQTYTVVQRVDYAEQSVAA